MKPVQMQSAEVQPGLVLARDVRGGGKVLFAKGRLLSETDAAQLRAQAPAELHLLQLEPGDLHEDPAGRRLAAAAAGEGTQVLAPSGGTFGLAARHRGIVEVEVARLLQLNELDDLIVTTLPHEQIAVEDEVVARAKVIPFVTSEAGVRRAEELARPGLVRVRPFVPLRVAAVVEERLETGVLERFRRDLQEKLTFFGSTLLPISPSGGSADALAQALRAALGAGAQLVLVAAGRAMDPLDPALQALALAGGRLLKQGVPAHPGALLWLGALGEVAVIGVPSCGVASKATALDLLLPRLCTGEPPSRSRLAALGAGGMLTRESSFRLPPYRRQSPRGELD